jgi:hypothetical protein
LDYDKASLWDINKALGKAMMKCVETAVHYLPLLVQEINRLKRTAKDGARNHH